MLFEPLHVEGFQSRPQVNLLYTLDITGWIKTLFATMAITKSSQRFLNIAKPSKIYGKLKDNVRQYLLNTSLHGLRYIGELKISFLERYEFVRSL